MLLPNPGELGHWYPKLARPALLPIAYLRYAGEILGWGVRRALGKAGLDDQARADAQAYVAAHAHGPRPSMPPDVVQRFVDRATDMASTVERIASPAEIPSAVARYLGALKLPPSLAMQERQATVVAIGEARPLLHETLAASVAVRDADDMGGAVRTAFGLASPGSVVVLAPACASFDMFADYAERGRVFKQEAMRLAAEWNGAREQ